MWNRRQLDRPAALVAASAGPSRLTNESKENESKENDSGVLGHHTSDGTNRVYQRVKLQELGKGPWQWS